MVDVLSQTCDMQSKHFSSQIQRLRFIHKQTVLPFLQIYLNTRKQNKYLVNNERDHIYTTQRI